jgi:hypothetical protein
MDPDLKAMLQVIIFVVVAACITMMTCTLLIWG